MHKECIVKRNAMHKNANRGTGENGRVQNVRVRLSKGGNKFYIDNIVSDIIVRARIYE